MLSIPHCRVRQSRLLAHLQRENFDAAVITLPQHVYYFTGHLPRWTHYAALILQSDGRTWLSCANQGVADAAADRIVAYEAAWMGTQRSDQVFALAEQVKQELGSARTQRVAVDASAISAQLAMTFGDKCVSLDSILWQMRRAKDADELAVMRKANACAEAMYKQARQIVEPGIAELEVFGQLHAAAVHAAGEAMSAPLGNDFACACGGGPARNGWRAKAGEIYILDLGPAVAGYFSDTCRAIAVDRKPTDKQIVAWQTLMEIFPLIEPLARPGARCRDLFAAADDHLRQAGYPGLGHHLGHGVGLQAHEFPHLNPRWDDTLIEGEVFTLEPGIYLPELAGGIRLENQYLVQSGGALNLTPFAMELM